MTPRNDDESSKKKEKISYNQSVFPRQPQPEALQALSINSKQIKPVPASQPPPPPPPLPTSLVPPSPPLPNSKTPPAPPVLPASNIPTSDGVKEIHSKSKNKPNISVPHPKPTNFLDEINKFNGVEGLRNRPKKTVIHIKKTEAPIMANKFLHEKLDLLRKNLMSSTDDSDNDDKQSVNSDFDDET